MIHCPTTARLLTLKYYDIVVCSNLQLFVVICIYLKPDGIVRLFLLGVVGLADTQYVRRDLKYVDEFLALDDVKLTEKQSEMLDVIRKVYEQQKFMFENKTHSVENRIVSISQPFIRPIVRGKAKSPVEFGAKLDLSVDENGMARVEKLSFDAYNESEVLKNAVENYKQRTGHYPERVLVDQIYRNRTNLNFCKEHGIRLSGKRLGRPKQQEPIRKPNTRTTQTVLKLSVSSVLQSVNSVLVCCTQN